MGELPLEVWADLLEEEGAATEDLRAWIAMGACSGNHCAAWLCDVYTLGGGAGPHSFFQELGCLSLANGDGTAGGYAHAPVYPRTHELHQPHCYWQATGNGLFDQDGNGLSYVSND